MIDADELVQALLALFVWQTAVSVALGVGSYWCMQAFHAGVRAWRVRRASVPFAERVDHLDRITSRMYARLLRVQARRERERQ